MRWLRNEQIATLELELWLNRDSTRNGNRTPSLTVGLPPRYRTTRLPRYSEPATQNYPLPIPCQN